MNYIIITLLILMFYYIKQKYYVTFMLVGLNLYIIYVINNELKFKKLI